MLTIIDDKLAFLVNREASLTEAECNKQNEFYVTAFSLIQA